MILNLFKMFPFLLGNKAIPTIGIADEHVYFKKEASEPYKFQKGGYCEEEERFRKIIESRNRK